MPCSVGPKMIRRPSLWFKVTKIYKHRKNKTTSYSRNKTCSPTKERIVKPQQISVENKVTLNPDIKI